MGTPLGPKYIPYTYMDPLGKEGLQMVCVQSVHARVDPEIVGP